MAEYEPTKWWKVLDGNGDLWCETSNEKEALESMREGDTLLRMYEKIEVKWMPVEGVSIKKIIQGRIERGCYACGNPWTEEDLAKKYPDRGMVCTACYEG